MVCFFGFAPLTNPISTAVFVVVFNMFLFNLASWPFNHSVMELYRSVTEIEMEAESDD